MVVHTCYPSTKEAEAGGLQIQGHPLLYSEALSQIKKNSILVAFFLHCLFWVSRTYFGNHIPKFVLL
jgi:hypothetical protein